MSIPLVQNNEKDSINTSIIAIKRQIERINMLLGLVDSGGSDPDLSGFVKKSDIVDIVESGNMNPVTSNAVVPVDEVTLGNMHSVTSNAVAGATQIVLNQNISLAYGFTVTEYCRYSKFGRLVIVDIGGLKAPASSLGQVWTTKLPIIRTRFVQQGFRDGYNMTQNGTFYGYTDTTTGVGHFPANIPLYCNFVYLTD